MGFQFEQVHSVSIELKKENDVLKEQLADAEKKPTAASKKNSKKNNS